MSFTGKSDWVSGSLWNGEFFVPLSASVLVGTGLSASSTADGKITIVNTGQSFDANASYITLGPTASLANERILTAGPGIFITDYGANNAVAISASLLAGPGITINQVSNSFAISSSVTVNVTGTWIEGSPSPRLRTSASVAIGSGTGFAQDFGTDIFFYVSGAKGTTSGKSVFGGDVTVSGNLITSGGLTGSLQKTLDGSAYIIGGTNITTATASNGQITIGVTGLAPSTASYLTITTDSTLTAERTIAIGTGLTASDAGANGAYTISINPVALSITGTWVEGSPSPRLRTTASVAIGTGTSFAQDFGSNIFFYVSGSKWMPNNSVLARYSVLNDTQISGNLIQGATNLITGNLPQTNLDSAIIASANATITVNAANNNLVILGSTGSSINTLSATGDQIVIIGSSGSLISQSINAGNTILNSNTSTISGSKYSTLIGSDTSIIQNSSSYAFMLGAVNGDIKKAQVGNGIIGGYSSKIYNSDANDVFLSAGANLNLIIGGNFNEIRNNVSDSLISTNQTANTVILGGSTAVLNNDGAIISNLSILGAYQPIITISGTQLIPTVTDNFAISILGGVTNTYGPAGLINGYSLGGMSNIFGSGINESGMVGGLVNSLLSHNALATQQSIMLGGGSNILNSSNAAAILGGTSNGLSGSSLNSVIVGGGTNSISGSVSSIINAGGNNVLRTSLKTAIIGGDTNLITASTGSLILGGSNNKITSTTNGAILGGSTNNLTANNSILIGTGLTSSLANSVYLGGTNNTLVLSATLGVKISGSHYEHISTFKTIAYTASLSDYIIPIDTAGAGGSVTVVLPSSIVERGRILVIKDVGGSANVKNIIISSSFGKIDNSTNYTISANYGAATLVCFSITAGGNTWGLM